MPSLFISHGAPDLLIGKLPARQFLLDLPAGLPRPRAICVASAHYEHDNPHVTCEQAPRTLHDFGGFAPSLYQVQYPARGDPQLAERVADLLEQAGFAPALDDQWGYDHGTWCPLALMYPHADVPVIALSVSRRRDAGWHLQLGRALAALRAEDVLVIGSGSLTHNLGEVAPPENNELAPDFVHAFADWFEQRLAAQDEPDLLDWPVKAPAARRNHPSSEHLMPLFVALGAAGEGWRATRLHRSVSYRALRLDAFRFDA